ncbi:MAG: hypothetical protein KJO41_09700 [Bacteroidia bacterium]|nr:hypothetical protein [Bacteroidia bacterium]NND25668.1 hypothetical protein [Flavobacteriaceae bacterium]MBT8279266.1 hypothetical protein [Bacteroidia bacterium]NNK59802.1 hypothetical protein [Flavobacteriaceae bacterium]NNL32066.1 hypothetical protein [Flavobacteriaceae bacterium]
MKKSVFFALLMSVIWSCSVDDNVSDEFHLEILPIRSVEGIPNEVHYNEVYTIDYTYTRPTTCHVYNDLYYLSEGDLRTVAVISTVFNETQGTICEPLNEEIEARSFTFHVQNNAGTYIFQFWQGEDENGEDQFLIYEVPIIQ